jgi:IclR family transcriptional regulator, pca regulon regulatory protein
LPVDPDPRNRKYSQSLERGLAVLGCFTAERPMLGITDFAKRLGMNKSAVHRYVTTLVALGYLEQSSFSPKYRLSLRVFDLGMSALDSLGLRERAHPELELLRQRSGCAVSLAVLEGTEIRCVDRVPGSHAERGKLEELRPGSKLPAHCTALGKLLLALLPEHERRERVAAIAPTATKRAPGTITGERELNRQLAQIAETGLAVSDEELAPQMVSIARPVRAETGSVVAAIGLTAHTTTISLERLLEHDPDLLATAERISLRLGFHPDGD